jgi:superfamily II DNA or RNA helicase/HKD family nuclease
MPFITNAGDFTLERRLEEIVPRCEKIKILVGFFYFSGLKKFYELLRKNSEVKLQILVGLLVDKTNYGLYEYGGEKGLSGDEIVERYIQSIKRSFNSEYFDNKEFYEQVSFFVELIKKNRIEIRKTREPNHGKLYLFYLQDTITPHLFITGSSNLTKAGLEGQNEFNVEIKDYGFEEAEKYFDSLWKRAVPLTEDNVNKERILQTLERETLLKSITPFQAYAYVLQCYLETYRGKEIGQSLEELMRQRGYTPYRYQIDAVQQALSILEQHHGVIIADVVGLGKTVIACAIGYELKKRGIVIAPPGLIGEDNGTDGWNKYLEEFRLASLGWKAFSLGVLDDVETYVNRAGDIEVVIVDEAHRFRNQDTESYEKLRNICRGKKVILLTATPFNNRPSDIFSLLKLFLLPKQSTITLDNNLKGIFASYKQVFDKLSYIKRYHDSVDKEKRERAFAYYKILFGEKAFDLKEVRKRSHLLASHIRHTIAPITIRRNRLDLLSHPVYSQEVNSLSRVADPQEWFYELSKEQSAFYDKVIRDYFSEATGRFHGAMYRPEAYRIGIKKAEENSLSGEENFRYFQQFNLYDFMRRLLVKRFESSFGAFRESVQNFRDITEKVKNFVFHTDKYVMDRRLLDELSTLDDDELNERLEKQKAEWESLSEEAATRNKNHEEVYDISTFQDKELFLQHLQEDRELFDEILSEMEKVGLSLVDPKAQMLIQKIQNLENDIPPKAGEPKRKVIIFSEYVDTVKYLEKVLREHFGERLLVVYSNLTRTKTEEIYKNFDASYSPQEDNYDILLTSDKLSEGFNLNRAGIVINYDIPWNPVRVIQRLGRINRISRKVFDTLYIVNFFPTEQGAELVDSRTIAANKMFLIHNTLGEDTKIFDTEEEPSPSRLYEWLNRNPDEIEEESFYTTVVKEFERIKNQYPEIVDSLVDLPPRIKVAKRGRENELYVVVKKGNLFVHYKNYTTNHKNAFSLQEVIENLRGSPTEEALPLSEGFWEHYEELLVFQSEEGEKESGQSREKQAYNNLKTLLRSPDTRLQPLKDFLRMLIEDIESYGTLPDFTLRRIADISPRDEDRDKAVVELQNLQKELGPRYLEVEKSRLAELRKEIIIAIENQQGG